MTEDPNNYQNKSQPAWVKLLGCAGGLIAFSLFVLNMLASCTDNPKADGSVIVDDQVNLISPWAKTAIEAVKFPEDTPVVVRTIDSIPAGKIGSFATDLMDKEPHWQTLRPRGFLRKYFRQDMPSGPGVYVLISRNPSLVQIRFGRDIRLAAYQENIAAGGWYREQQQFANDQFDQQIVNTVQQLSEKMRSVADPWWLLGWAQYLSSLVVSEVEDFFAPSDGLYSHQVLTRYIQLGDFFGGMHSAWGFVIFNLLCFISLWLIGKKLLIYTLLLPRIKTNWIRGILHVLTNLGLLGVLVTGFAAVATLSRGRIEDQLALDALGLSFLSSAGFDPVLFSTSGGLWLAIPGVVISLRGPANRR